MEAGGPRPASRRAPARPPADPEGRCGGHSWTPTGSCSAPASHRSPSSARAVWRRTPATSPRAAGVGRADAPSSASSLGSPAAGVRRPARCPGARWTCGAGWGTWKPGAPGPAPHRGRSRGTSWTRGAGWSSWKPGAPGSTPRRRRSAGRLDLRGSSAGSAAAAWKPAPRPWLPPAERPRGRSGAHRAPPVPVTAEEPRLALCLEFVKRPQTYTSTTITVMPPP